MEEGRSPLLLTERKAHLEHLYQRFIREGDVADLDKTSDELRREIAQLRLELGDRAVKPDIT